MINLPPISGDISLLEAAMTIAIFTTGYVIHELFHVIPLYLAGDEYAITFLPRDTGESRLHAILFGTVVKIDLLSRIPSWRVILSALAPALVAPLPVTGIAVALTYPSIDIGTAVFLFAWFAVSIPSLADWKLVIQELATPGSTTEVMVDA